MLNKLIVLALCAALVALAADPPFNNAALETLTYEWTGAAGNGLWEDIDNWSPRGYPRSGTHTAVIARADTITHTRFLVAGEIRITVAGALLRVDSNIGYLIGQRTSLPPPYVAVDGEVLGDDLLITVTDFGLADFASPINVTVDNVSNDPAQQTIVVELEPVVGTDAEDDYAPSVAYGVFRGRVPTACRRFPADDNDDADRVVYASPFDQVRVSYTGSTGSRFWATTFLNYVDVHQRVLGAQRLNGILFKAAVRRNLVGLRSLNERLAWIVEHLPAHDGGGCCADAGYRYPLQMSAIAKASYEFLRGPGSTPNDDDDAADDAAAVNRASCTDICSFSERIEAQLVDGGVGPVDIRWTGLGGDTSWNNPRNWWPARVPDGSSVRAWLWSRDKVSVNIESDVLLAELHIESPDTVDVNAGPFTVAVLAPAHATSTDIEAYRTSYVAPALRRIWFANSIAEGRDSLDWGNPSRWSLARASPSAHLHSDGNDAAAQSLPFFRRAARTARRSTPLNGEVAVLAGFGSVSLESQNATDVWRLVNRGSSAKVTGDIGAPQRIIDAGKLTELSPRIETSSPLAK